MQLRMEENVTCERVREAVQKIAKAITEMRDNEKSKFLTHIRTCGECRQSLSQEERGLAIYAIVSSFE